MNSVAGRKLLGLAVLWMLLLALFSIAIPAFFQASTITSILQFSTILALVTLGQALVVLAGGGGIDLSVGGMVSLSGLFLAWAGGTGALVAPLVAIGVGMVLGAVNGLLVTRLRLAPLIATLGTLYAYGGLAIALTGGSPQRGVPPALTPLGRALLGRLPISFLLTAVSLFAIAQFTLSATPAGPWTWATGRDENAACLVGIPVARLLQAMYALSGALAGVAALVAGAWLQSARPDIGINLELDSLTATLLGGVSIARGAGTPAGTLLAVPFLQSLKTERQLADVNGISQTGVVGLLLQASLQADRLLGCRRSA
jgi:ribose/xylose/arabinose/galactoside ABC-type transport system permease subunit